LRANGLTIVFPDDTLHVAPARAVADPADAPVADVVLVCVKSYDTPEAAAALRPVVGADTIVVSLQNGIENEETIARTLGLPPLLVALTRIGVELTAPGTVTYSGRGEIVFGEPDGMESPRARRLAGALAAAGVPHQLRRHVLVHAWAKLAWNAAVNAIPPLADVTVADATSDPATRDLIVRTMIEVDAVAVACGIPVRRGRLEVVLADSASGLADFPTSMLQDRRRGRRLEYDAINGAVIRAAARAGVSVPLNRTLAALLARLDPAASLANA